jgi:SHAQKYF class myb-like DNA-binding protein
MAATSKRQQSGKEERKMGRDGNEGDYEEMQYLPAQVEEEPREGVGGSLEQGREDSCEGVKEDGVEEGPEGEHRRQYRNRKYRRLAPNLPVVSIPVSTSNSSLSSEVGRSRAHSLSLAEEGEEEKAAPAESTTPVVSTPDSLGGLGKGKHFLFKQPKLPAAPTSQAAKAHASQARARNPKRAASPASSPRAGLTNASKGESGGASGGGSGAGAHTRNRRRAALKAEAAMHKANSGREGVGEGGGSPGPGGQGGRGSEDEGEDGKEDGGEEEEESGEIDESLMSLRFPPQHETDFVGAVFKLGLQCSSPKVLMDLMPMTDTLTTEHIKSHLQKYRLHGQRSKEEFVEYYNGYMRGPFASFCARREWEHDRSPYGPDGLLPPLFAHGHRRLPPALGGGNRQHHLQQVQALTVRREGGREGGRRGHE